MFPSFPGFPGGFPGFRDDWAIDLPEDVQEEMRQRTDCMYTYVAEATHRSGLLVPFRVFLCFC